MAIIETFNFKDQLEITLTDEDYAHALLNHADEVSVDKIKKCIEDPDLVIESRAGANGCLFYEKLEDGIYFTVVVHVIGNGRGNIKTAYDSENIKKGKVLYNKQEQL
jgi:hypothetical protein